MSEITHLESTWVARSEMQNLALLFSLLKVFRLMIQTMLSHIFQPWNMALAIVTRSMQITHLNLHSDVMHIMKCARNGQLSYPDQYNKWMSNPDDFLSERWFNLLTFYRYTNLRQTFVHLLNSNFWRYRYCTRTSSRINDRSLVVTMIAYLLLVPGTPYQLLVQATWVGHMWQTTTLCTSIPVLYGWHHLWYLGWY